MIALVDTAIITRMNATMPITATIRRDCSVQRWRAFSRVTEAL